MTVFYRKYRPKTLSGVTGQEHVKKALLGQLESGKIAHAYLFAGPKGTGKTTTARIIARALNCEKSKEGLFSEPCNECNSCKAILEDRYLDVYEIDAASNRGIDDIRDLREKIKLAPLLGKFKVYIIDESHMLTNEAFNALLKTLEEPPAHAIFILATTTPEKIPPTIASRTQRFDFKRAAPDELKKALEVVVKGEDLTIPHDLLDKIIKRSDGSFRDGISYLDQLASSQFSKDELDSLISASLPQKVAEFVDFLLNHDARGAILYLNELISGGVEVSRFVHDVSSWLRFVFFTKVGFDEELGVSELDEDLRKKLASQAHEFSKDELLTLMKKWVAASQDVKLSTLPQLPIEILIAEFCGTDEKKTTVSPKSEDMEDKKVAVEPQKTKVQVREVPKKTRVSRSSQVSLESIRSSWPEVLEKLKGQSSIKTLLGRCEVKDISDGKLILNVAFKFHKERLEEERNRFFLESALRELFGSPIKVDFELKKSN